MVKKLNDKLLQLKRCHDEGPQIIKNQQCDEFLRRKQVMPGVKTSKLAQLFIMLRQF